MSLASLALITLCLSPAPGPGSGTARPAATELEAALDTLAGCDRLHDRACLVAAAHLNLQGDAAVGPIRRRLHRLPGAGQLLALSVVDGRHTRAATEAILAFATDRRLDPAVRALAVDDLSKRAHRRINARLLRALRDPAPIVRAAAARVLSNRLYSADKRLLPALLRAARDPHPAVRLEALFGCGFSGDPAAGPVLTAALDDPLTDIRRAAAEGLGLVPYPKAIDPLIAALSDDDPIVVQAAARALERQTGLALGDDRASWDRWREAHP